MCMVYSLRKEPILITDPSAKPIASKIWSKMFLPPGLSSKEIGHLLSSSPHPCELTHLKITVMVVDEMTCDSISGVGH